MIKGHSYRSGLLPLTVINTSKLYKKSLKIITFWKGKVMQQKTRSGQR